jgi:hypothetical protein
MCLLVREKIGSKTWGTLLINKQKIFKHGFRSNRNA